MQRWSKHAELEIARMQETNSAYFQCEHEIEYRNRRHAPTLHWPREQLAASAVRGQDGSRRLCRLPRPLRCIPRLGAPQLPGVRSAYASPPSLRVPRVREMGPSPLRRGQQETHRAGSARPPPTSFGSGSRRATPTHAGHQRLRRQRGTARPRLRRLQRFHHRERCP